jgi:TPR repeat protein
MYRDGEGVRQDYVQAHMWFNLAAAGPRNKSRYMIAEYRDDPAKKMTPAQIAYLHLRCNRSRDLLQVLQPFARLSGDGR